MDVLVPQTSGIDAYDQAVWSWHLDAGVKLAGDPVSDGG